MSVYCLHEALVTCWRRNPGFTFSFLVTIVHFPPWLEQLLKSAFPLLSHTITSDNTELLFVHRGEGLYLALSRHKLYRDPTAPAAASRQTVRPSVTSSRGAAVGREASQPARVRATPTRGCEARLRLQPPPPAPVPGGQRAMRASWRRPWHVCSPSLSTSAREGEDQAVPAPADGEITSPRRRALSAASCAARGGLTARRTADTAGT